MFSRLVLFTGVTFLLYTIGILIGYIAFRSAFVSNFIWIFLGASVAFTVVNFLYYYSVFSSSTNMVKEKINEVLSDEHIDLLKDIEIPGFQSVTDFFRRFRDMMSDIVSKLITSAMKSSIFSAKFNHELKKSIDAINENMAQFDAINSTMNDASQAIADISKNVEEFSNFVNEIENASKEVLKVTNDVEESMESNVKMMEGGEKLINQLSDNLKNISNIVNVINDIADQTNLLALNAAIEAARAGEAGRGFAVVADEVRKLAEKTQVNASEIYEMINTISKSAEKLIEENLKIAREIRKSGEKTSEIKSTFGSLASEIEKASQMLSNITAAVEEQSASVEEVTQTVSTVSQSTREVVGELNEVVKKSANLVKGSDQIFNILQKKLRVNHPLTDIRNLLEEGKREIEATIENAIRNGTISSSDIWDRNYVPIPNTNPQRYKTRFTEFFKMYIQPIEDKYLEKNSRLKYFVIMDDNGYAPAHNSIYDKPLTGDYEKDLVGNRSMRTYTDPISTKCVKNTKGLLVQTYARDTGEAMIDLSVPIYIEGKHWGVLRAGFEP